MELSYFIPEGLSADDTNVIVSIAYIEELHSFDPEPKNTISISKLFQYKSKLLYKKGKEVIYYCDPGISKSLLSTELIWR